MIGEMGVPEKLDANLIDHWWALPATNCTWKEALSRAIILIVAI